MKSAVLAAALLSFPAALAAQDTWVEVKFDRIHLRNGNTIDGKVVAQTPLEITLSITGGEMSIRYSLIEKVEVVTMKSINQPAKLLERATTATTKTPDIVKTPTKTPEVQGDVKKSVIDIVKRWRAANKETRVEVMKELIPLGKPAALMLASTLDQFGEAELQELVAPALTELKDPELIPLIAPLLKAQKPFQRASAAMLLATQGDVSVAPELLGGLKDPDAGVRAATVGALHDLGAKDAIDAIARLGIDPDNNVRNMALSMFLNMCNKFDRKRDATDILTTLLDQAQGNAKADIALALGQTKDKAAITPLKRLLDDDNANARSMALVSLGNLNASEVSDLIADKMRNERDKGTKIYFCTTAEKLVIRAAAPMLIEWMKDGDANLAGTAHVALKAVTGQSFGPDPLTWESWWATQPK